MSDVILSTIKDVAELLNVYVKSKDNSKIGEIENSLETFFLASTVNIWKYDKKNTSFTLLRDRSVKSMLDTSLTEQIIKSKNILIENHITSNKFYVQVTDNPLNLKVKSLLMFPIVKDRDVIGVIRLWRGIKQKKVFTKRDEKLIESFSPLLVKVIYGNEIDKEELLALVGNNTDFRENVVKNVSKQDVFKMSIDVSDNRTVKVENVFKSEASKSEATQIEQEKFLLKKELEKYKKEAKRFKVEIEGTKKLKKELDILSQEKITLKKELTEYKNKYDKELVSLKEESKKLYNEKSILENLVEESTNKYKEVENSALEFSKLIGEHQDRNAKLNDEVKHLSLLNEDLEDEVKILIKSKKSDTIQKIKSENSILKSNYDEISDVSIENVLHYAARKFGKYEHSHLVFEMTLYALSSKNGLSEIEERLIKHKFVPGMIESYSFNREIQVQNEKTIIATVIDKVKKYSKDIFSSIKIEIEISKNLPTSLVIDAPKVQSILYHLLFDMAQIIDDTQTISLNINYKNKLLIIELGGFLQQNNSILKSMFKNKIGGNEKDRQSLILSKKLAERLKGKIESTYTDTNYKFTLSIPAQKIKM